ncbi:MAG: hypothetical protein J5658_05955 [Prevotella sp.]|nr:hypothetical protein [Prevotella sp.]
MDRFLCPLIWLRRITHCRGFGIQSPTDYWLVRYVINEHWPYYQYASFENGDDWLTRKLGRLYFRMANWRQPTVIDSDGYQNYFHAGCKKATFGDSSELVRMTLDGDYRQRLASIYNKVYDDTVLIVEGIWRNRSFWKELRADERAVITFDLYYCGIVLFDKKRQKQNYIINF